MTLTGHLIELRRRVIASLLAVVLAFAFTYTFSEELYHILIAPLLDALPEDNKSMAFLGVAEPFFTYLKVAFLAALIASSPVILYELWAFVVPALYEKERRWFFSVVVASVVLFSTGVCFAYIVVFPLAFEYLLAFSGPELRPMLSMTNYLSLSTKLLLAFGLSFQVPLFMLVLARLGIVGYKRMLSWWRYALLLAVVFGAMLTPPDVVSQVLLAVPLMALYFFGVLLACIFGKKKDKNS